MLDDLAGRVALVTGGATGIGGAIIPAPILAFLAVVGLRTSD